MRSVHELGPQSGQPDTYLLLMQFILFTDGIKIITEFLGMLVSVLSYLIYNRIFHNSSPTGPPDSARTDYSACSAVLRNSAARKDFL